MTSFVTHPPLNIRPTKRTLTNARPKRAHTATTMTITTKDEGAQAAARTRPPATVQPVQRDPNLWQKFRIWIGNLIPIDSWLPLGLLTLVVRRGVLEELNLLRAPDAPPAEPANPVLPYRTADASGTDPKDAQAGAQFYPFARNMTPNPVRNPDREPNVQLVAQKLLARKQFQPAGDQLNVLAAAWIQFMSHDWMRGMQTDEDVELAKGSGCPLNRFKFKKTDISSQGTVKNERTHWWDTSVLYGQDRESLGRIRSFSGGRLKTGPKRGVLPRNPDGTVCAGDNINSWAAVQLLQDLFLQEHNAIADCIATEHPEFDDEKLFNTARLVVAAVAAKIHTIDWTPALLYMNVLKVGMDANWYGLPRAFGGPPAPFSRVGKTSDNHGVPFALTEEFVAIYRLHPLLPDALPLASGRLNLEDLVGEPGEQVLLKDGMAMEMWDAIVKYPCGHLLLFNYPSALRNLLPTTPEGKPIAEPVDLAALDLYRDRERGIRNFNDFRRALHMKPFKTYKELTGETEGPSPVADKLEEVYGANGIEKVDLLVGNLAEKKIRGFALSETSFTVFLLMASRRLEADRFLNEDFNEKTYTRAGFAWVKNTDGIRDVLRRHFPELERHFKTKDVSAFRPTTEWPAEYLRPQV